MSFLSNVYLRSFLKAFAGSAMVLIPGVLAAPSLGVATGLIASAMIASLVAGFKAVEVQLGL